MQNSRPIYAGFFVRFFAYLVDVVLVGAVLLGYKFTMWTLSLSSPDNFLVRNLLFEYSLADIISYGCIALYFILMTHYAGATLGKKLFHLRVISVDGSRLTWTNVIYRETIGRFLSEVILFIGYFMIAVDEEKKGFHDILCDTRVVYMHPQKKYYVPLQPVRQMPPMNQMRPPQPPVQSAQQMDLPQLTDTTQQEKENTQLPEGMQQDNPQPSEEKSDKDNNINN